MSKKSFSLVVPFYNETDIIRNYAILKKTLEKITPEYELIFVSDGSEKKYIDELISLIKKDKRTLLISYAKNQGRGYALTQGFKKSRGKYVAYIDGDLELKPIYLLDIFQLLKKYNIVTASKYHPDSKVDSPRLRKVSSYIFNIVVRLVLGSKITDHQIGLKGFQSEVVEKILPQIHEKRWLFDIEFLYLAQKYGYSFKEIPINLRYGFGGVRSSFVYDFLKLYIIIFAIKFRHINK